MNDEKTFKGFTGKLTEKYLYIGSKTDENKKYRVSGSIGALWKYIEKNQEKILLIPLMKKLSSSIKFTVETRTTRNNSTGNWLWIQGYTPCYGVPQGTLGGLDPLGSTFLGEFDENTGMPICLGNNRNSQNKGAMKGEKTQKSIESEESRKWSEEEIEWLRTEKRREEERKWDLRNGRR